MVRVKINHFAGKPNPYRMNSPTASIAVRGTEFSIEVSAQGDTQVVVYEGAVEVSSLSDPARRVLIEAGRGVLVQAGQDFHLLAAAAAALDATGVERRRIATGARRHRQRRTRRCRTGTARARRCPTGPAGIPQAPPQQPQALRRQMGPQVAGAGHSPHDREEYVAARQRQHVRPLPGFAGGYRPIAVPVPLQCLPGGAPGQPGESRLRHRIPQRRRAHFHAAHISRRRERCRNINRHSGPSGNCRAITASRRRFRSLRPRVNSFSAAAPRFPAWATRRSPLRRSSRPAHWSTTPTRNTTTSGNSSTTYYSGALVAARTFGANSFGVELSSLKGTGSLASVTREAEGPGHLAEENIQSASDITQTRITAGYSRNLSRTTTLGVFYRYAFIRADDRDVSHTINGLPARVEQYAHRRPFVGDRDAAARVC